MLVHGSETLDSAGTPRNSLANNQHYYKSVWLRAARRLICAHADSSNPLQAASDDIQAEPTRSVLNSPSASAIYSITFVPPLSIFDQSTE